MAQTPSTLKTKHSVRAKLLSAILVSSSVVTLVLTCLQLANDYRADLGYIQQRMKDIQVSRSATLSKALWNLDTSLIETGLEGLLSVQDVIYVEISDQPDQKTEIGQATYKRGVYDPKQAIVFTEPLFRTVDATEETPTLKAGTKIPIGHLTVVFTKNLIYQRLENKAVYIMITQALKTFVTSALIMFFIRLLVTQHLSAMASYFDNFDIGNLNESLKLNKKAPKKKIRNGVEEDTRDELDLVADSINKMVEKVKETYRQQQEHQEQLQALNASLDTRVKEQTAELAEEKRQMVILLDNMSQSVFRVGADRKIVAPISKFSGEMFKRSVEGSELFDLIFNKAELDAMAKDNIEGLFGLAFGEDSLNWEMNEQNLPEKIVMKESGQVLRLKYSPLFNERDELTQILFVIEDITKMQKLEEQRLKSSRELALLQAFAAAKSRDRIAFFSACREQLEGVEKRLAKGIDAEALSECYRALHTLKGNARMLKFEDIAQATHTLESQISDYLAKVRAGEPATSSDDQTILSALTKLRQTAVEAANIGVRFFGLSLPLSTEASEQSNKAAAVEVLRVSLDRLKEALEKARALHHSQDFVTIREAVHHLGDVSLSEGVEKLRPMVDEISGRVGKEVDFVTEGSEVALAPRLLEKLTDATVHIVRNALDHGLETPAERQAATKAPRAMLKIAWSEMAGQRMRLTITDDGRGIDAEKVYRKALAMGAVKEGQPLTTEDKLKLIFIPTLSTAEQVSDLSGRGVGMDAVVNTLRDLNGEVLVKSELGKGTTFVLEFSTETGAPGLAARAA